MRLHSLLQKNRQSNILHTEGPKLLRAVKSALSLLVDGVSVFSPVCCPGAHFIKHEHVEPELREAPSFQFHKARLLNLEHKGSVEEVPEAEVTHTQSLLPLTHVMHILETFER